MSLNPSTVTLTLFNLTGVNHDSCNKEDRGYSYEFDIADLICTINASVIFFFMIIPSYYLFKTNPFKKSSISPKEPKIDHVKSNSVPSSPKSDRSNEKNNNKSVLSVMSRVPTGNSGKTSHLSNQQEKIAWYLGIIAATLYFLRQLFDVLFWFAWMITYEYCPGSFASVTDNGIQICNVFATSSLYLYFIYRLYNLYQKSSGMCVLVQSSVYILYIHLYFIFCMYTTYIVACS